MFAKQSDQVLGRGLEGQVPDIQLLTHNEHLAAAEVWPRMEKYTSPPDSLSAEIDVRTRRKANEPLAGSNTGRAIWGRRLE
jgi:hypothetical protein